MSKLSKPIEELRLNMVEICYASLGKAVKFKGILKYFSWLLAYFTSLKMITNNYSLLKMTLGRYKFEKTFSIEYPIGH